MLFLVPMSRAREVQNRETKKKKQKTETGVCPMLLGNYIFSNLGTGD